MEMLMRTHTFIFCVKQGSWVQYIITYSILEYGRICDCIVIGLLYSVSQFHHSRPKHVWVSLCKQYLSDACFLFDYLTFVDCFSTCILQKRCVLFWFSAGRRPMHRYLFTDFNWWFIKKNMYVKTFFVGEKSNTKIFFYHFRMYTLSLIHIWRCRRYAVCRSRWSPYH